MRQIKKFMEAKRPMWNCNECKCITMQCWKESEAFCGCGESKSSLPNYVKTLEDESGQYWVRFFNDNEEQNNTIKIEEDEETGGMRVVVGDFLAIEDEDARALWLSRWESLDAEAIEKFFGRYDEGNTGIGHFTSEAMAKFNAFFNNPTEEQADSLKEWLEDIASDEYDPPRYPIIIFDLPNYVEVEGDTTYGGNIQFFNEYDSDEQGNSISVEIDTDTEGGGYRMVVGPFEIIKDEDARALWIHIWEGLDGETIAKLFGMDEGKTGVGHFIPEAMTQFNALINNPTEDSAAGLKQWLESKASDGQLIVVFD